ncbi:MAG TPA: glutamyl-tRNA reductase [Sediminibacterium sp.]|nr:glutamyl-tRNA reductase [Sediminibacterium sp.]
MLFKNISGIPLWGKNAAVSTDMDINQFFVAGINYKKSDAAVRGEFAVGTDQYAQSLADARAEGLEEVFVLSTCNRTEIYGLTGDVNQLIQLLCRHTSGSVETFTQLSYIKQGRDAIDHIFAVGAGLDSQILGDYEIVGQMKTAVKFARENHCMGAFIERLFNTVLQASKAIKNQTALSGGTISVSFAAIQFLKSQLIDKHPVRILLLGTGKIGRNTCKNLVDYLRHPEIVLMNRTEDRALELAAELGLRTAPLTSLEEEIKTADVVIVATNAEKAVITSQHLLSAGPKVLIDLSIPNNIDPAVAKLPGVILANVDDLSRINDATLQKRQAEVPKAEAIIRTHFQEFSAWHAGRSHVPVLRAVKQKLHDMQSCGLYLASAPAAHVVSHADIQKVVNNVAVKLRQQHQPGCYYIEAINDFMTLN